MSSSERTRGNGLKEFSIRKNFVVERVANLWNRLLGEVAESPPLEVLKNHVDVAFEDVV